MLIPTLGLLGAALSFTTAELILFSLLVRRTREHAHVEVRRPLGWALAASLPMVILLLLWPLSLPKSIAAGAVSFAVASAAILRRGTVARGLA